MHYYAKFGFVNEGVSGSTHGGVVWYQMRLKSEGGDLEWPTPCSGRIQRKNNF